MPISELVTMSLAIQFFGVPPQVYNCARSSRKGRKDKSMVSSGHCSQYSICIPFIDQKKPNYMLTIFIPGKAHVVAFVVGE